MCDVRKKLILFDYAISKFAEWTSERKSVSINEALKEFSTTQIMKLMYLTSLQCITTKDSSYRKTPFSKLDKWVAYKNGPVEDDVYWSLSYLPTIQKNVENPYQLRENTDNDKIKDFFRLDSIDLSDNAKLRDQLISQYGLSEEKESLDAGIKAITNINGFPFDNVDKLIRISHSGMLWSAAQHSEDKRMSTDNIYLLKEEKERINSHLF